MLALSALADPTRRAILELLARQGTANATAIGAEFPCTASAISQHLKCLVEAGLLTREARGQQRFYRVDVRGFEELEKWLARTRWFAAQGGEVAHPQTAPIPDKSPGE